MSISEPLVTVAIPTYNRGEVLFDTILDIYKQTEQNFEILIIDQSDKVDNLYKKRIEKLSNDFRFRYFHVTPPNVTTARNFALSKAKSEIIIFLDDDVRLKKDLVEQFLVTFSERKDLSAVGGRVMQAGFPILDEILQFDSYVISHGVFTSKKCGFTNAFAGGNCALKVKDAIKVGGFDTRYRDNAFREESDMSMKMTNSGMKIFYQPKAELLHLAAPRGGNRVFGDIWDHYGTYKNEIFFTFRFCKKRNLLRALNRKNFIICRSGRTIFNKRQLYFLAAIPASMLRFLKPQINAKETTL
jgi:glycosyltransferase involved in cell wall biosynthesis